MSVSKLENSEWKNRENPFFLHNTFVMCPRLVCAEENQEWHDMMASSRDIVLRKKRYIFLGRVSFHLLLVGLACVLDLNWITRLAVLT